MSVHINADQGSIAETVLLPGDPKRAKYIAENLLENAVCYNEVRGMLGYTGYCNGHRVSVQSTGMGMPSAGIYIYELLNEYNVKNLVRIGTTGALKEHIKIGDLIVPLCVATDSAMFKPLSLSFNLPLSANAELLTKAILHSKDNNINVHFGSVLTSDTFYSENDEAINKLVEDYGVLAVEMETAILYQLSQKFKAKALSVLTVSDQIVTGEKADSLTREQKFMNMVNYALGIVTDTVNAQELA
ncbi:purine-nucleoside phosphorylase [Thiotrichales bacterium 19S3-7]|nr:purine-nucleoside phosphorylase [Thiotrichales bacterium 19S3-7]MCF6802990.1 purine-nucleoside phosphorylase [Thiotrichales bacterium 19S3-11]